MNVRAALLLSLCAWLVGGAPAQKSALERPRSVSEQYLFEAANAERTERGLPALHWDSALFHAAGSHAHEMAERQSISHQYAGEPDLTERGHQSGARFSTIAENVAMAPTAVRIHDAWMHSEGHRRNLLDPNVDAVGISVLQRNGELYAVEDFDRSVDDLSFDEQEQRIGQLIAAAGPVNVLPASEDARQTCSMGSGYAGTRRPYFVMRFTASDLTRLPEPLQAKLATGKYREAAVGACPVKQKQAFTAFNVAVLLYP